MVRSSVAAPEGDTWIKAIDAVHLISSHVGGDKAAKKAIIERLKDHAIRACAGWTAWAIDVGLPYRSSSITIPLDESGSPPKLSAQDLAEMQRVAAKPRISFTEFGDGIAFKVGDACLLGGGLWSRGVKADVHRFDWHAGFFIETHQPGELRFPDIAIANLDDFPIRYFAYGVKFSEKDISRILGPGTVTETAKRPAKGARSSPRNAVFVAELFKLHNEDDLSKSNANEIYENIINRLSSRGQDEISKSVAYPIIQEVLGVLAKRKTP